MAPSRAPLLAVAGFGLGIWHVRLLGCASRKQFSRLQKTFLLLREAHAAPPRSNRRSASQQFDVAGCLRSVLLCARMRAAAGGTGVQVNTFEVGLDFQEELGEVFGYLLADSRS